MYGNGQSEEYPGPGAGRQAVPGRSSPPSGGTPPRLKEGERGGDPALVRRCLEASLKRLGTDYVDHYLLHRPDPDTPQDETLGVLEELRDEGKIREIGCSDFTADQLDDATAQRSRRASPTTPRCRTTTASSPAMPETGGVLEACARPDGVRPLLPARVGPADRQVPPGRGAARGLPAGAGASGPRRSSTTTSSPPSAASTPGPGQGPHAAGAGHGLATNPQIASVIAGATKPAQVAANAAPAGWAMSHEERAEIDIVLAG